MSDAYDTVKVTLLLADYIAVDATGKLNVIGGNIQMVGYNPNTALTGPFACAALLEFPHALVQEAPAIELVLEDEAGIPVPMPNPAGPDAPPQYVRLGNAAPLSEPAFPPGVFVPKGTVGPRAQIVLYFQNGLPLTPGRSYAFRIRVDSETRSHWALTFFVPGPMPGPVIG